MTHDGHRDLPAIPRRTHHLIGGNPGAIEGHLPEFLGDSADHLQRPLLYTGLVHRNDERRKAAMLGHVLFGPRQQQTPVGDVGIAGPDLVAVNDILVTLASGGGRQRRQVRPRAWLAEALAPPLGAVDHAWQETLL